MCVPEDLSSLSEESLRAQLDELTTRSNAIYKERTALEQEVIRRKVSERGDLLEKVLAHGSFGTSVRVEAWLDIRLPDGDWIEHDYEAQDLSHAASRDFNGTPASGSTFMVEFRGHKFSARNLGDRLLVQPMDVTDLGQWAVLLDAAKHLRVYEYHLTPGVVLPLFRERLNSAKG